VVEIRTVLVVSDSDGCDVCGRDDTDVFVDDPDIGGNIMGNGKIGCNAAV
jgi:hypothetical protein